MLEQNPYYVAQMTASVSSTGGGKVYLDAGQNGENYVPTESDFVEGDTRTRGLALSMQGMNQMKVSFTTWQKANDGYYFAGWSYADNGFDLGKRKPTDAEVDIFSDLYDVGTEKSTYVIEDDAPKVGEDGNVVYEEGEYFPAVYALYATFEPIRISGYSLSGSNTTHPEEGNKVCTQTVTFTFSGENIDANDFNVPAIVPADANWTVNNDFTVNSTTKTGTVTVTFSTDDVNHTTSSANLRLTTKAGVSIDITLDARTATASDKDLALYDGKTYKSDMDFADEEFAASVAACAKPIIKLNKNYNSALTIDNDLTLDLCGYTIPGLTVNADKEVTLAFSPYGGTISGAVTNNGTLTLVGGTLAGTLTNNGTLFQNGATINGAVTNNGTMTTTDGVHAQTVTTTSGSVLTVNGGQFVPASGEAIDVQANATATIKKGTIEGKTYGVQSAGSTTIEKLAVISGGTKALKQTAGTLTVNCGKFTNPTKLKEGTIVFNSGYFKEDGSQASIEGKKIWRNTSGAEFRENYLFFAGDANAAKAAGVSVCHIGGTSYSTLENAFAYANTTNDHVIIIMDNDYTLPAGYYTLPANAVLIVPKNNEQGNETKTVERAIYSETPGYEVNYVTPTKFRCLTLSEGVNLDVHGTIEVSGSQFSSHHAYTSAVYGPYGQLQLNRGSKITLQNGSELRAWGYVTGDIASADAQKNVPMGEIDARRGSTVREQFQMGDWKGAAFSGMGLLEGNPVFPLNTYFIQNIEAPVKYHPGAVLSTAAGVTAAESEWGGYAEAVSGFLGTANISMSANDIKIIGVTQGEPAMFLMDAAADADNTWVRKWYDASKDQQVYEINSGAHIGNLIIPLVSSPFFTEFNIGGSNLPEDLTMNSGQYFLPITNNFKLHLLSGEMAFTQSTELLPGSEVEVDKGATVYVYPEDTDPNVKSGFLCVYDADEWGNYAGGVPARHVQYSPVFGGEPTTRGITLADMTDASINVHGTFDTRGGYVLTSESGANIYSSEEDAGTFMFSEEGAYAGTKTLGQVTTATGGGQEDLDFTAAKLKNKANYTNTASTTAGSAYCYMNMGNGGEWTMLEQRGCVTYNASDRKCYIKPQEYVEIAVSDSIWDADIEEWEVFKGNDDHTFSDAAGTGRLFILLTDETGNDCQWWEVEQKDNYYHCLHPENDTYYEWDEHLYPIEDDLEPGVIIGYTPGWKEKKFTITWKNWDGTLIDTYQVPYGTQAEWLSTNPTREKNLDYTYDFTGWSPALGKVTSDVTYTATYEAKQIKYTIVFEQDGGMEIERHLLARNEMPVCENEPTRTGYILQWEPALAAVTHDTTYVATWLPEPPEKYEIKFMDYNGTTELKKDSVEVGTVPTSPAIVNGKPQKEDESFGGKSATTEYTYVFDHWSPALEEVSATSAKVYTAVYREVARNYTVSYFRENGTTLISSEELPYGATPTAPVVSKENPADGYTYTYVWKTTDGSKTIETVTAAASYKPVFTGTKNKYTVTLQCNLPGKCSFTGAGIYEHNTFATISATPVDGYEFVKWQERSGDANLGPVAVTDNISLTAVVKESAKPAPGNLNLGVDADPVTISSATDYMDLSITSNGIDASSQIVNANNITLYGNADFVFKQNIKAGYWYSFAVPWRVDATSGVYLGGSSTSAVLGKDFEIIYYDGAVRAAQGKVDACWVYLKNLSTKKVLEPGRAYMIFIKHGSQSQIVFRKKVQEPLLTTTTTINQYSAASDLDANWNAIANPALYKAYMYAGADPKGFYYKSEDDLFDWYHLKDEKLVVGEAVYIQAPNAEPIVANASSYAAAAPRRERAEQATSFDVQIAAAGAAKRADHISVQIDENKEENKYIIGKDLTKFGVSARVAQMWINRYDVKLCFNTIAPEGESTFFPMSIYAPKAGAYTIAIEREVATEDYNLYLTYNGEAIWNLSDGAYTANLNKGTDANYGLRISAKAPQTATGMDEAVVDSKDAAAYKVLIGNQVFIIRGEKVYSMDGQLVK